MMNETWSKYIQTTEELYESRSLRFTDENKSLWLDAIGAAPDSRILELGCAGGVFCHKLKKYLPGADITGVDLDSGHIAYAKAKAKELGIDCTFLCADATSLPFADGSFDLCYSHTVCEHIPHDDFFGEQFRILKPGGRICVLSVRTKLGIKCEGWCPDDGEESRLLEKAWSRAGNFDAGHNIGAYELDEHDYPLELEKYGFRDVNVSMFTVIDYAPDNASVSDETAIRQINSRRLACLSSARKALNISPDALTRAESERLYELINLRFDRRIEQYNSGERLWDFSTTAVLAVSGIK